MEEILKELGLTDNEIKIYLFLLKNGESTTGPIIKETKIANSRVYESLNSLISKGFVGYNLKKDGKHFQAIDPKILLDKQKELKEKIEYLIPQLSNLKSKKESETTLAIYEGFQGFKTAFKIIIDVCSKKDEILTLGFSLPISKLENLRLFLKNIDVKRIKKKVKMKIIFDKNMKKTIGKDREEEPLTEVRYMPKGYISPAAMNISKDYVLIEIWEEKPYVFVIKNKKIADSFKSYYQFLWKIARP